MNKLFLILLCTITSLMGLGENCLAIKIQEVENTDTVFMRFIKDHVLKYFIDNELLNNYAVISSNQDTTFIKIYFLKNGIYRKTNLYFQKFRGLRMLYDASFKRIELKKSGLDIYFHHGGKPFKISDGWTLIRRDNQIELICSPENKHSK